MGSDRIRIDTGKLEEISRQFEQLYGTLTSISTGIAGISGTAHYVVPEQTGVIRSIDSLKSRVAASGAYARRLSVAVGNASAQWAAAEKSLITTMDEGEDPFSEESGGAGSSFGDDGIIPQWLKDLIKGLTDAKDIATFVSGEMILLFPEVLDFISKTGGDIAKWLDGKKGPIAKWAKDLLKASDGNAIKAFTDGLTSASGWVISTVSAIFDNFSLLQEGNGARFVTETVSETAVNVLLSAGGAAAATLILGAGAPAIAVAAVGGAIVFSVNAVVEYFTGDDIAGHIGEFIGDITDQVVPVLQDGLNAVVDTGKVILETGGQIVSDIGNALCDWFAPIFG